MATITTVEQAEYYRKNPRTRQERCHIYSHFNQPRFVRLEEKICQLAASGIEITSYLYDLIHAKYFEELAFLNLKSRLEGKAKREQKEEGRGGKPAKNLVLLDPEQTYQVYRLLHPDLIINTLGIENFHQLMYGMPTPDGLIFEIESERCRLAGVSEYTLIRSFTPHPDKEQQYHSYQDKEYIANNLDVPYQRRGFANKPSHALGEVLNIVDPSIPNLPVYIGKGWKVIYMTPHGNFLDTDTSTRQYFLSFSRGTFQFAIDQRLGHIIPDFNPPDISSETDFPKGCLMGSYSRLILSCPSNGHSSN